LIKSSHIAHSLRHPLDDNDEKVIQIGGVRGSFGTGLEGRAMAQSLALVLFGMTSCKGGGSGYAEAAAYAAAAGALTAANEVAKASAAKNAGGGEHYVGCSATDCYSDPDMALDDARSYALLYVNRVRAESGAPALALDHRPHQHIADDPRACWQCSEEQSDPQGLPPAPMKDQILGVLDGMMSTGPGAATHDDLLARGWHRLGVGIANPDGQTYVTIDLAP
jgi:hypothetical protein